MKLLPFVCATLAFAVSPAAAQRPIQQGDTLLSADAVEKLKLSAEQKEKYTKLETEFKTKNKDALTRIRADAGGDRTKAREAMQKYQTEAKKDRDDYLTKVEAFLTAEQKTALATARQDQPRRPGAPAAAASPQTLTPALLERLQLSTDQKKKIDDLQKEVETKILNVLTDEQRKQLNDLKGKTRRRPPQEQSIQQETRPQEAGLSSVRDYPRGLKTRRLS